MRKQDRVAAGAAIRIPIQRERRGVEDEGDAELQTRRGLDDIALADVVARLSIKQRR